MATKHSKWYAIAKKNVENGRWNQTMLDNVYEAKRITKAEYAELSAFFDTNQ